MEDEYLRMAMERYVKALDIDSDCFAAGNGVGMVFARRGKPEIARKAFQCVRDHKAMEDNPSIYINLAHTYIQTHGVRRRKRGFGDDAESEPETEERIANTRKAISLYQKAKELNPDDVSVNLHIAKALNNLKDYDEAAAVLSEAAHNWPFDMLVKINQAKNWEDWAKHTLRVYRGFRAIQKPGCLEKDCLTSAVAAWNFISNYWSEMTSIECGLLSRRSGHPEGLKTFMSNIKEHIANLQQLIETVKVRVQELAQQIRHNDLQLERLNIEKKEGEREAETRAKDCCNHPYSQLTLVSAPHIDPHSWGTGFSCTLIFPKTAKNSEAFRREKYLEAEDQALRLMESGRHIRLGRNLDADIGGDAANTISGIFDDEIPHDDEEVLTKERDEILAAQLEREQLANQVQKELADLEQQIQDVSQQNAKLQEELPFVRAELDSKLRDKEEAKRLTEKGSSKSMPACNKCKQSSAQEGDSWCLGCSSVELSLSLLKRPWKLQGLRAVAEETLLSSARLVRAFANLDQSLGGQSAGSNDRAPATTAKAKAARAAHSRSPRRDERPPLPRSPRQAVKTEHPVERESEETDFEEEGEEEEEDFRPPTGPP
eukprot:s2195_g10.t1